MESSGVGLEIYHGSAPTSDYLGFGESVVSSHDQSSGEIWDMDNHTVRRYNPAPDPVSPGPTNHQPPTTNHPARPAVTRPPAPLPQDGSLPPPPRCPPRHHLAITRYNRYAITGYVP
jgi:hypothetical protein